MAEVISTLSQLTHAFKTHWKISSAEKEEISHILLLFYAVECGLKAKYLKNFNGLNTSDFEKLPVSKKHGHSHDLRQWAKELKIPNSGFANDPNKPIVQLHEQLRYGTFQKTELGNEQIKFLKDLIKYLKTQL